ncbi:mannitol dehydrogenase family protein [Polaromonas sp.]|uniref:mannitol dehydrogenase family protein n=1 Tax=Polaromonas sp. TaxID=1869339 RepID=UPI003267B5E1
MAAQLLSPAALGSLPPSVRLPIYPRRSQAAGVVHLGLGAFHRAHQAMVFDTLLEQGDARWGVIGVAMKSTAVADALDAQDGLYSVQITGLPDAHCRVIATLWQTCVAAREPNTVTYALAAPSTRWVTLTVTEKGYTPALAELIAGGLALRCRAGLPGLTIASCDNLSGNGDLLRSLCLQAAEGDSALRDWISSACAFPNSMVDRIVPAATATVAQAALQLLGVRDAAALATEGFWEWILEDRLADASDAASLRLAGVQVVPDVRPFEVAKLRMLNGSHSAIAAVGAVLGLPTVSDCMAQPEIAKFIHGLMTKELMPHVTRPRADAYRDALLARFANPALQHQAHQIATDFSKKIPQRWVPAVLARLKAGEPAEHLAFAAAAWMRYCRGEDESGRSYELSDPLGQTLLATARQHRGDCVATVRSLMNMEVWGTELANDGPWAGRIGHWLQRINAAGMRAALAQAIATN